MVIGSLRIYGDFLDLLPNAEMWERIESYRYSYLDRYYRFYVDAGDISC